MKLFLPLILAASLCSCSTMVYEGGQPVLKTYADIEGLEFRTPRGTYLKGNFSHSKPTRAAGSFAGTVETGLAGILATWFTGGVVR